MRRAEPNGRSLGVEPDTLQRRGSDDDLSWPHPQLKDRGRQMWLRRDHDFQGGQCWGQWAGTRKQKNLSKCNLQHFILLLFLAQILQRLFCG